MEKSLLAVAFLTSFSLSQGYSVPSDPLNIAYNKTTDQSSQWTTHPAWLAVDGNTDGTQIPGNGRGGEFSHTYTDPKQWWRVDLGQIYYVYRVKLWSRVTHLYRLSHISILSSTDVDPPPPSLSSDSWISLSYREERYNAIGEETFNDPATARHLAVFNNGTGGVTLVEFQAFGVQLPCDWTTESSRRLVPYISGPTFTVSDVADLVSCQRACVECTSFICAAVNYNSVSRSCQLLEENDQTAVPLPASSWQYSLRPICAGLWQPWTATKGKYLNIGVTKFDRQNTKDLRSCMTRCIQDNVNTTIVDYRCRSVIKSIASPGVCDLVDLRSDDTCIISIISEADTNYQYFDRPHWYTDSAKGSSNTEVKSYGARGSDYNIFTGQKIEADGYLVAWKYYIGQRDTPCPSSYASVWRFVSSGTYKLIMETLLLPTNASSGGVRFQYITDTAVKVKKDDVIGTHVRSPWNDCGNLISFKNGGFLALHGIAASFTDVKVNSTTSPADRQTRKIALRPYIAEYLRVSSVSVSYGAHVTSNQVKLNWSIPEGMNKQSIEGGGYMVECSEREKFSETTNCSAGFIRMDMTRSITLHLESTQKKYYAQVKVVRNFKGQKLWDETKIISSAFCAKRGKLPTSDVNVTEAGLLQPGEKRTVRIQIPSLNDNSDQCVTSVMINDISTGRSADQRFEVDQGQRFNISVRVNITGGLSQIIWAETHRTKQVPPAPLGLSMSLRETNSSVLNWDRINGYNDSVILKYQVSCSVTNATFSSDENVTDTSYNTTGTESTLTAHRLHPQVQYSCKVKALLKDGGYGHSSEPEVFWTKPSYPNITISIDDLPAEVDSGKVTIKLPNTTGSRFSEHFNKVVIVVSKVPDGSRKRRSLTDLLIDGSNTYKTAEFPLLGSNETFTIGDGHKYGPYDNIKLHIGSYQFYVGYQAVTEEDVDQFYQITSQPIRVEPPPTTTTDGRPGGMSSVVIPIGAAAVGVIVVTIFVIGGLVIYRRRKSHSNDSDEYDDAMATSVGKHTRGPQTPAADRVVMSNLLALEESHAYEEMASSVQGFHEMSISQLHDTILEEKQNNPSMPFKEEFLKIGSPNVNCKIGRLSKNMMKNRLRSVTANDESRVVLSLQGYQTDYINANYIKDSTGGPGFIAAQGPTDESLEDMWRMVNDTNTNTIVMLTNLFESGKEKCSVYWPESATEKKYIGRFTIQLVDEQRCAEYVVRKLKYEFNKTSRNVMHYQFVHWSDQYLPSTLGLLSFRNRVKKDMKSHKGLTIIHCSEGCGKTGTYIALDLLIDEAHDVKRAKHQTVNVMKCVYDLRLQRTQMVQTANQYAFLYDLLSEALECREPAVDCSQFPQQLINWRQARKGNHTILKEHFKKVVASRSASSEAPNDAGLYENTNDSVPPLSRSGEGFMRGIITPSDTVNAVYVDSYVKRCGFIATQAPPNKIKGYYWRMIMETKYPVIVYFNDSQGAEEYWPRRANTEMTYSDIHVKCLSANQITDCSSDSSMSTECKLVCKAPETTQEIKHIEVKVGSYLPTADQLVSLCTMLEKYAMSRSSTITVQCNDGSRLTGILIVALNIYLRMILDQEVDVVMEVKLARRSRPQFIPDFETFDLLFDFVSNYLSQHNDYQSLSERRGSEYEAETYASLHHYSN